MKITCAKCQKEFDWKPPSDTDVYKMLTARDLKEIGRAQKRRRYVATCPHCKTKLSIYC